jgi:capsid protein
VEMGLLTRREIYAKKGKDIEEVALALKEEREIFKKYGINFEGTNVNETDN